MSWRHFELHNYNNSRNNDRLHHYHSRNVSSDINSRYYRDVIALRILDTRNYRSVMNFSRNGLIFHCNFELIDNVAINLIKLLPLTADWTHDALSNALSYVVACGGFNALNGRNDIF